MSDREAPDLGALGEAFGLGPLHSAEPLGSGHIHETFVVTVGASGREVVLQRLNEEVFPDLDAVMANLERIAAHEPVAAWVPVLLRTPTGAALWRDARGRAWRASELVTGGVSVDRTDDPATARECARAFGAFAAGLASLPDPPLHDPLPGFHDTEARRRAFEAALEEDPRGRAAGIAAEVDHLREVRALATALAPTLPVRVTHNDTKLNNVLLDRTTGRALAVVDLDTVAPGPLAWDFGDMVRSAANAAPEDTEDPTQAVLRTPIFDALVEGWFEGTGDLMTGPERASLVTGVEVIAYELSLRFATDWLLGDRYFRIRDATHNLRRLRGQLHLLGSVQRQRDDLEARVAAQG